MTWPFSNLFLLFSDLDSCLSPVSPFSPKIVRKTFASVPARLTLPVTTFTVYFFATKRQHTGYNHVYTERS